MQSLLEFLIQGVVLGGLYALFAVGITLIFGVLNVINVAHGEFFAVGGYVLFAVVVLLHLPPVIGVVAGGSGAFLLGLFPYPLLIPPLQRRTGRPPPRALSPGLTLSVSRFHKSSLLAIRSGDYRRPPPRSTGLP